MAYTDPIPENYNGSSISVDSSRLLGCWGIINSNVESIANFIGNINVTLSELTLSWTGDAAGAASAYTAEWINAVQALLGTENDPSTGALSILVGGLQKAAQNYSANEAAVMSMFNGFEFGFSSSPPSSTPAEVIAGAIRSVTPSVDTPSVPAGSGQDTVHTTSVNES